jgi:hypothetical protein
MEVFMSRLHLLPLIFKQFTVWGVNSESGKVRCIMLHGKGRRNGITDGAHLPSEKDGVFEAIRLRMRGGRPKRKVAESGV